MTTVVVSASDTGMGTSAAASSTSSAAGDDDGGGSGLGTSSIIGLSVAGGVAVIGVVAFFIWKFTRKRFGEYDDGAYKAEPSFLTASDDRTDHVPSDFN